jgi:hypothetical protein
MSPLWSHSSTRRSNWLLYNTDHVSSSESAVCTYIGSLCMYACMYVRMCMRVLCMCACIHGCMCICMYVCMHARRHMCIEAKFDTLPSVRMKRRLAVIRRNWNCHWPPIKRIKWLSLDMLRTRHDKTYEIIRNTWSGQCLLCNLQALLGRSSIAGFRAETYRQACFHGGRR